MMVDSVIEKLNLWGGEFVRIALPVFWQSSLLIAGMFVLDLFLRRSLRASVRHALWLVVLIKLLLPPSLALPSGIAWWLRPREVAPAKPPVTSYIVTYGPTHATIPLSISSPRIIPAPQIRLSRAAWALFGTAATGLMLFLIMLVRWRLLRQQLRKSESAPIWLEEMVHDTQRKAGCRRRVRLVLTDVSISPALCGLLRPVIVLPSALVQKLRPDQLQAVLLHELFHLRNGDVWVNCFQSLLQIVFWWHPFLWFANARIRKIREEVVDDSVRLALGEEAETYAPTLLEVARLALARPLATLGLVGILESRNALKQRVDRLVNFPAPRRAGLSIVSAFAILAFAGVALPMGQAPPKIVKSVRPSNSNAFLAESAKFIQIAQNDAKAPGFDYYLGNVLMNNSNIDLHGGTAPSFAGSPSEKLGWDIQPLNENGWVEYNMESGITTATNGARVKHGGTTISADNITVNQHTGETFASGSVKIQTEANPTVEIESDNVRYDAATGTATATGHPVLKQGDQVVQDRMTLQKTLQAEGITYEAYRKQADNTTFDSKGSNVLVDGHFVSKSATGDAKSVQLAQNQSPGVFSYRIQQTSSGKRAIMNKLEAIRLNHVAFDNLPLSEVVKNLQEEARKRDSEGKGINFILNPNTDLDGAAGPPAIDPATGLQIPPQQAEPVDINGVAIRILPPLEDVRMLDVLDAIIKVANPRLRYSIEDYGISFRVAGNSTPVPLFTRVIKVDPNIFAQGLESVVGFSVGNFQTGGQGGGGQGNGSGVTVPRVQVAPNAGGQGGLGGQGGAQGGAGGISGVTRSTLSRLNQPTTTGATTAAMQQVVKQFLSSAGVDLYPPKNVFFNDKEGELLVHATMNDLDIIEQAVMALNAGRVIASPSTSRPTTVSVRDSPVAGKVAAANSPQQIPNANASNTEKLLTETMGVGDPIVFSKWVKKTAGLQDNANSQERMDAFRKILLDRGLQLAPPANVIYNERNGILFVRAIRPEINVIEQIVQEVNRESAQMSAQAIPPNPVPQVNIKARFVEVSAEDTKLLGLNDASAQFRSNAPYVFSIPISADTNSSLVTVLTDPQFRVVLHALEQRDGVDVVSENNVTTVSGRQAQMQNADIQTIVKLNPQALIPPGVASSNLLLPETLASGPLLDIIPYVAEGGDKIQLTITAKVTEFLGYDPPPENAESVPVYVDGQATTIKQPHPQIHVRTMEAAVNFYDGQTVMLGRPKDEMVTYDKEGKARSTPSTSKRNLLVFVTATVIDAAGNPVHNPDGTPAAPRHN
jgi:beta-lactamase regulating signal transducer with metallopeptidase domain/lipopolysaccharide export system protein LptA